MKKEGWVHQRLSGFDLIVIAEMEEFHSLLKGQKPPSLYVVNIRLIDDKRIRRPSHRDLVQHGHHVRQRSDPRHGSRHLGAMLLIGPLSREDQAGVCTESTKVRKRNWNRDR